ncbi:hypothetical protein C8J57DRAFT_1461669 [Mycena rebaudengoi]|nr:hypothetical protein C8J57DRAFT_1461669 [Mycena rebaudengoi]
MESRCTYGPRCGFARPRKPLPEPPTHLCNSNNAPLESDVHFARERIAAGRAYLSEIDDEMIHLESLLAARFQERQDVENNIEQHLAIVSPIRCLPSDVLAEIFSWTLPHHTEVNYISTDVSLSPWVLGRVCSRWRNLVLALPALWSHIGIHEPHTPTISILNLQLDRSKRCPLNIRLVSSRIREMKALLNHCERWYTVYLAVDEWAVPYLNQAAGRFPLLQNLSYRGFSLSSCNAFEIAPRLSHVVAPDDAAEAALLLPYEQLTRLHHQTPRTLVAATVLCRAHNLTRMMLVGPSTLQNIGSFIELPRLHTLFVNDDSEAFLNLLVLPALKDIWISQDLPALLALIRRSSCSLRKLSSLTSRPEETLTILAHTPKLAELHCSDVTMEVVSRLTIPIPSEASPDILCSSLTTLHLLCYTDASSAKITQLMESRQKSALCPALSLHVHSVLPTEPTPFTLEMRSRLRMRGLRIEWTPSSTYLKSLVQEYIIV